MSDALTPQPDPEREVLYEQLARLHADARGCEFDLTPADGPIAKLAIFMHEHGDRIVAALRRPAPAADGGVALREAVLAGFYKGASWRESYPDGSYDKRAKEVADEYVAALTATPPRPSVPDELVRRLLGEETNGGFIRNLCYTVWQKARWGFDGAPGDWTSDTLPTVQAGVAHLRSLIAGEEGA